MDPLQRMSSFTIPAYPRSFQNQGQKAAWAEPTRIGHMSKLDIQNNPDGVRRSSIICTIGPKTGSVEMLTALRQAGLNIMRLNFSHGSHEFHGGLISNMRESCRLHPGPPVAIALDTKGPEIRTGIMKDGDVKLESGDRITLHTDESYYEFGTKTDVYCDYKNLPKVVTPGSYVFIDDGLLSLQVLSVTATTVSCELKNSGVLGSRKGCNLPNIDVDLPALSEKDKADLKWGVEQDIDIIFASFVRKASDIAEIRECLGEKGKNIKVIAKIENHEGIRNFPEILKVVDGVMVARGDLGIEVPSEKVFLAQKMIIAMCNVAGVPVICATQMLDSMTYNPRPTRAEVSDVANAVLDGADCVMLSGETAKGNYPVETVQMMANICREAEAVFTAKVTFDELKALTPTPSISETMAMAAVEAAYKQDASAIVVMSTSGRTGGMVSKYRPRCPIIVVTREEKVARQVHLYRGTFPLIFRQESLPSFQDDIDARLNWSLSEAVNVGMILPGTTVVVLQGWRGGPGNTNTMRILKVPDVKNAMA